MMEIDIPLAKKMTTMAEQAQEAQLKKKQEEDQLHKQSLDIHIETVIKVLSDTIQKEAKQGTFTTKYEFPEYLQLVKKGTFFRLTSQDVRYMLPKIAEVFKKKGYRVIEFGYPDKSIVIEWF